MTLAGFKTSSAMVLLSQTPDPSCATSPRPVPIGLYAQAKFREDGRQAGDKGLMFTFGSALLHNGIGGFPVGIW